MSGSFHDFDKAWQEEDDEPIVVRLLDEEWKCKRPSEVPAALLLKMDRMLLQVAKAASAGADADLEFEVDDVLDPETILRQLAGDDNVDAWLGRGLPYPRLMAVSRYLTAKYRGQDPGEAPAANRAQKRAAAKKTSPSKKSSSTGAR